MTCFVESPPYKKNHSEIVYRQLKYIKLNTHIRQAQNIATEMKNKSIFIKTVCYRYINTNVIYNIEYNTDKKHTL